MLRHSCRMLFGCLAFVFIGCGSKKLPSIATTALTVIRCDGASEIQVASGPWTLTITNQPIHAGSRLRTGTNSFVEVKSSRSGHRVMLPEHSEAEIERWTEIPSGGGVEDILIDVH